NHLIMDTRPLRHYRALTFSAISIRVALGRWVLGLDSGGKTVVSLNSWSDRIGRWRNGPVHFRRPLLTLLLVSSASTAFSSQLIPLVGHIKCLVRSYFGTSS